MRVYACMHLNVHACMQVRRQVAEGSKDELTMKGHVADLSAALKQVGACILYLLIAHDEGACSRPQRISQAGGCMHIVHLCIHCKVLFVLYAMRCVYK